MLKIDDTLKFLERRLHEPKPGLKSQLKMVTEPRPGNKTYFEAAKESRPAGVLVLIYPWKGKLHLVLTRRTSTVAHHQAQISFPGGEKDTAETIVQAALREAQEEIGIAPDSIRILGELTPLFIPPSNYCIYPVVAASLTRPLFQPSPREVAEVIEVPLSHLLNPKTIHKEVWKLRGIDVVVPFYLFKGHKIWGATAMVLAEIIDLLSA